MRTSPRASRYAPRVGSPRWCSASQSRTWARTRSHTRRPERNSGSRLPVSNSEAYGDRRAALIAVRSSTWSPTATPTLAPTLASSLPTVVKTPYGSGSPDRYSATTAAPRPGVAAVVTGGATLAELERPECVDHDGQLVESFGTQTRLDGAGLGAVRVTARMQRDRPLTDPGALAGLVVTAAVEHHLVGVDVGVVVGDRDRQRVVVDLAGHEVAHHEVLPLEHLVHRGRLVHTAGDRLEVVDIEDVRVQTPVPADHVERVLRHDVHRADQTTRTVATVFDVDLDVGLIDSDRFPRYPQVSFTVRRVLEQLAIAGEVAPGRSNVAGRLDAVGAYGARTRRDPAVRRRPRDNDVVTGPDVEVPEHRLHGGRAVLDVHTLITRGVPVERGGRRGDDIADAHVTIAQYQAPRGDDVGCCRVFVREQAVQHQMPGEQRLVRRGALFGQRPWPGVDQSRGHAGVIEQRRVRGEALLADQLFKVQRPVWAPMLSVPFGWDVSDTAVVRHHCLRSSVGPNC